MELPRTFFGVVLDVPKTPGFFDSGLALPSPLLCGFLFCLARGLDSFTALVFACERLVPTVHLRCSDPINALTISRGLGLNESKAPSVLSSVSVSGPQALGSLLPALTDLGLDTLVDALEGLAPLVTAVTVLDKAPTPAVAVARSFSEHVLHARQVLLWVPIAIGVAVLGSSPRGAASYGLLLSLLSRNQAGDPRLDPLPHSSLFKASLIHVHGRQKCCRGQYRDPMHRTGPLSASRAVHPHHSHIVHVVVVPRHGIPGPDDFITVRAPTGREKHKCRGHGGLQSESKII
mmetsp:Transcript_17371/g.50722  ORF Transcript_17371/g.50722 Transcript_17371/m.50722 type:complete len:290 (-) Transcript_17371:129-998(-)